MESFALASYRVCNVTQFSIIHRIEILDFFDYRLMLVTNVLLLFFPAFYSPSFDFVYAVLSLPAADRQAHHVLRRFVEKMRQEKIELWIDW